MHKKVLFLGVLAIFSTQIWAGPAELEKRKVELTANIMEAVKQCKCLATAIDRKEKLFPMTAKAKDTSPIKTQADYLNLISDMKINANRGQTSAKEILTSWNPEKNTDQDLKNLDIKISTELRALSSFCIQPFNAIADDIYKRSSILTRKKIDPSQCGIVQNKK